MTIDQRTLPYASYDHWLEAELMKRCQKNPRYSLRAFAKTLNLSPAFISRILSGKRTLTLPSSEKIADALAFSPEERKHFFDLVLKNHREKTFPKSANSQSKTEKFEVLSLDAFSAISQWVHYAITELTFLKNFKNDPRWIAKMLGIGVMEAKAAIERLKRLGILIEQKGKLIKTTKSLTTTYDIPSAAIQRFHKQILEKAIESLEDHPVTERDMSSITMAIDESKIPLAKKKIKHFRRNLCTFLESGKQTRVYTLAIQLFPISEKSPVSLKRWHHKKGEPL